MTTRPPHIAAITFDFWRTLFRDTQSEPRRRLRLDAFCAVTRVDLEAANEAMDRCVLEFDRCHREEQRTLEPEDAVDIMSAHVGVEVSEEARGRLAEVFAAAILEYPPEPVAGALEAVAAAAARRPVGVISDSGLSPSGSLRALLDRGGFMPFLKALVFSDELRVAKPQRPMYERAAQALGVLPHELLHIGDLEYTDVKGAKAVGASAALFWGDKSGPVPATAADYAFESWADFVAALPDLCGE